MTIIRLFVLCVFAIGFLFFPAVLVFAKIAAPEKSLGSIVNGPDGNPVGSRLVAQAFTNPGYFHPRPSAVDYNSQGAAGSNLSPTNPALADRAAAIAKSYDASAGNPIPADLVTASGSGLDPDITLAGAIYQIPRVSNARSIPPEKLHSMIHSVKRPLMGKLGGPELVNVLELNLALDQFTR
ncbi:MAG: potassium-transporting ATPase subunit C [Akkermansiaceae bacterium]|jgi:K+-transporting ATPase ATPase C chain|nr:potassium-transporting ATPase subunit C [Akkermansiaceae bacterium]